MDNKNPPDVPQQPETEEEKLKRLQQEAEIRKVGPNAPDVHTGDDTVGVGMPAAQPVSQGNSLPQSAIPVKSKFEGADFYNPQDAENSAIQKERANSGAQKTEE